MKMMTRTARIAAFSVLAASAASANGCSNDLPEPAAGGVIQGTLDFAGTVPEAFAVPAVLVGAFRDFPPTAPSVSLLVLEEPDFSAGPMDYELRSVPAGDYFVLAQLKDLEEEAQADDPLGGFPTSCALTDSEIGPVTVTDDAPTTGIDVTLYEQGGATDPCLALTDVCPTEGNATLELDLVKADPPGPGDVMVVALFNVSPPEGLPAEFRQFTGDALNFPVTFVANDLEPGGWAITVCYDVGGGDLFNDCAGEGDIAEAVDEGALIDLQAGDIINVEFDFDSRTNTAPASVDPASVPCE